MAGRILIVEDESVTAEDLAEVLQGLGYEVTGVVSNGADAIRSVAAFPPDLVLMDIRIRGDIDGTETASILRESFQLPVVFLTAHADRETLNRAKRSHPAGYIVKPFQEASLHVSLEMALHRHRQDLLSRDRQQHLTDVLGALALGMVSVDPSGSVLLFNPLAEDLTGWSKEEAAGAPVNQVFRLEDSASGKPVDLPLREVLSKRSLIEMRDLLLITKSGKRRPVSGTIAPVPGSDGGPNGVIILFESTPAAAIVPVLTVNVKPDTASQVLEFGRFHIIAASESMKKLVVFAQRVARSGATTILLEGESGTGKDLMAQYLHHLSSRRAGPFVGINCAAIPEALLESELFGSEAGAFTDARAMKKGLFEIADGGTLFLDEVSELSPAVQAKLLRALEERSFRRLGGLRDIEVDIRVIAATNSPLSDAVQAGRFRLDLFHRLSVIQISLPPLRERTDAVVPLALYFIQQYNVKFKTSIEGLSSAAAELLLNHEWPGNARELRNVMERAVLLEETKWILPANIHFVSVGVRRPAGPAGDARAPMAPSDFSLQSSARQLIVKALEKTGGNKTKAAALLGISRDVLRYRMRKLNVPDARAASGGGR